VTPTPRSARIPAPPRAAHVDVVYTSDLHGHRLFYEQALELARARRARALILGGDLAPHARPPEQRRFFEEYFLPLFREFLGDPGSPPVYYILGNDDWRSGLPTLERAGIERLHHIHLAVRPFLAGTWITGLASVTVTPFGMKDWERWEEGLDDPRARWDGWRSAPDGTLHEFDFRGREDRERITRDLDAIEGAATAHGAAPPLVCVFHAPPHRTPLDQIAPGVHVGSREIRHFVERRRLLVALHGHIHESPAVSGRYADRVGGTICVNPGQRLGERLHAVWFDLADVEGTLTHTVFGRARL
jgi:Icc-related predicted phosphoesterase